MLFSIIMPAYNAVAFLAEAVRSVQRQSCGDFELLIIDDASTDGTHELALTLAEDDKRIRLLANSRNAGSAAARNRGIAAAAGDYIAFLDADDYWAPEFLASQHRLITTEGADFVCAGYAMIDTAGSAVLQPHRVAGRYTYHQVLRYNPIGASTAIYHAAKLGKLYFDTSLGSVRDDYDLWLRILKRTHFVQANPEVLAYYRLSPGSSTRSKARLLAPHWRIFRREGLSVPVATFYMLIWLLKSLQKYHIRKL